MKIPLHTIFKKLGLNLSEIPESDIDTVKKELDDFIEIEELLKNEDGKEITKEEFKKIYFENADPMSGWTQEYWDEFYENKKNVKYFLTPKKTKDQNRMFISSASNGHRIYFLTEDAEESFFNQCDINK